MSAVWDDPDDRTRSSRKAPEPVQASRLWCDASGVPEGADNSTHHLVAPARGGRMVCVKCRRTEKNILAEAGANR